MLLEAFAETIETGKPFPVTTADMLDVAGAFEAIIRSMAEGGPVAVRRGSGGVNYVALFAGLPSASTANSPISARLIAAWRVGEVICAPIRSVT